MTFLGPWSQECNEACCSIHQPRHPPSRQSTLSVDVLTRHQLVQVRSHKITSSRSGAPTPAGGCHQHTSVRREVWYPDGVYEDDSFDPDAVEYLVDAHTLQRTWSFTGGSVARACPDILVETYICYAVAHQLVHRAYDWVWVLLRLLFAYASSRGGVKAVQWLLRRGTLWGPHMGMPARMAVSEGLPRWAVLSTAGMVVAGMACAWFLQGWVTRLLRPSYEGWVSGKALTLVAEAGYSPDVLADFARDVGDRSDADTVARQVRPRAWRRGMTWEDDVSIREISSPHRLRGVPHPLAERVFFPHRLNIVFPSMPLPSLTLTLATTHAPPCTSDQRVLSSARAGGALLPGPFALADSRPRALQVGPGILCPCAARMDCPLSGSAPMVAMHCEYRSGSALASVWESSR